MVGINAGAIPATLRRTNERTIIGLLMRMGQASRADLAKAAGLSQPTAGKITSDLLDLGILQEAEEALTNPALGIPARVGRPGRMLRLNHQQPRFIGIELDVAETRLSALPIAVGAEDHWEISTATTGSPRDWKKNIEQAAAKFKTRDLWGVVISVPGIVDEKAGEVIFSPNLHWTEGINLPQLIQEIWDLPVLLVQEIRALALGHLAANPEAEDFLLVDFGHGVGGSIVGGGKLYSNPLPCNAELGHTPVLGNQRRCGCGATGCVETLLSKSGLLESFAVAHPGHPKDWATLIQVLSDQGVPSWLSSSLDAMAVIIAGSLNILGLKRVVITGYLTELPPEVIAHLTQAIQTGSIWARFGKILCETAPRRRGAGLAGIGLDRLLVPAAFHEGLRPRTV